MGSGQLVSFRIMEDSSAIHSVFAKHYRQVREILHQLVDALSELYDEKSFQTVQTTVEFLEIDIERLANNLLFDDEHSTNPVYHLDEIDSERGGHQLVNADLRPSSLLASIINHMEFLINRIGFLKLFFSEIRQAKLMVSLCVVHLRKIQTTQHDLVLKQISESSVRRLSTTTIKMRESLAIAPSDCIQPLLHEDRTFENIFRLLEEMLELIADKPRTKSEANSRLQGLNQKQESLHKALLDALACYIDEEDDFQCQLLAQLQQSFTAIEVSLLRYYDSAEICNDLPKILQFIKRHAKKVKMVSALLMVISIFTMPALTPIFGAIAMAMDCTELNEVYERCRNISLTGKILRHDVKDMLFTVAKIGAMVGGYELYIELGPYVQGIIDKSLNCSSFALDTAELLILLDVSRREHQLQDDFVEETSSRTIEGIKYSALSRLDPEDFPGFDHTPPWYKTTCKLEEIGIDDEVHSDCRYTQLPGA